MNISPIDTPLSSEQKLEALKIAHETKDPDVKRAALALLNVMWITSYRPGLSSHLPQSYPHDHAGWIS